MKKSKPQSLSTHQARKLVLHSQRLPPGKLKGRAKDATLAAIEHLSYVQIDTISVIQRAHHHTLWNRNPRYKTTQLDQLICDKQIFEYWSHAAAYMPMRDYRFSLHKKQSIASGAQDHWYPRDPKMIKFVLDRITSEGPLMAKDFKHNGKTTADWGSKPAKQALEYLFMQGDLMIPRRSNFHKVYDLTERVLPAGINANKPSDEQYARYLIYRFLNANGLGLVSEMGYLQKNIKHQLEETLQQMLADNEVQLVTVANNTYFMLPESIALLDKPLSRLKLKILSPFDNLLIQRKRMHTLFDFDYQMECYLPAVKRKYGYFVLPILWQGQLLARMDCKADRGAKVLYILKLVLEPRITNKDAFIVALHLELKAFMQFNGSQKISFKITADNALNKLLKVGIAP